MQEMCATCRNCKATKSRSYNGPKPDDPDYRYSNEHADKWEYTIEYQCALYPKWIEVEAEHWCGQYEPKEPVPEKSKLKKTRADYPPGDYL